MEKDSNFPVIERRVARLSGLSQILLESELLLADKFDRFLTNLGQTVVCKHTPYRFKNPGYGVTLSRVLAESHAVLSSWPEKRDGFVEIDLVTCSQDHSRKDFDKMLLFIFSPRQLISYAITSGQDGISKITSQGVYSKTSLPDQRFPGGRYRYKQALISL